MGSVVFSRYPWWGEVGVSFFFSLQTDFQQFLVLELTPHFPLYLTKWGLK